MSARARKPRVMAFTEYLEGCKDNPRYYATAAQRLLRAMGEPKMVDTSADARLSRIFHNATIRTFPESFGDFYGVEDSIQRLWLALKAASQGLEEKKQILYLLGPVGGGKSSMAERLKQLMEREPMYVLAVRKKTRKGDIVAGEYTYSPLYESPLGLIPRSEAKAIHEEYGVPAHLINGICSPWAAKRLREFDGDVTQFFVCEMYPSVRDQIGVTQVAPGDKDNQDISTLVGKVDVRQLEMYAPDDPDAYSYSGGLCRASQGLLDFVEMFKAPIDVLNPLLTATQEGWFAGTENGGVMPFRGIIFAHSNEAEWDKFRNDKRNEAFLDRVRLVEFRYNLRLTEEQMIYRKLVTGSELASMPIDPFALELLADTVIGSRLEPTAKASPQDKVRIWDGTFDRSQVPNAPTLYDLQKEAGEGEGMDGISTRDAFKIIGQAANAEDGEPSLDFVKLIGVMKRELSLKYGNDKAKGWVTYLDDASKGWLKKKVGLLIRESLLADFDQYGQIRFDRYVAMAEIAVNADVGGYKDPDTGQLLARSEIEKRLAEIEKVAEIGNSKDFRYEVINWVLRFKASHGGTSPRWQDYERMRLVIERLIEHDTEKMLPLISFGPKRELIEDEKHAAFLVRMEQRGFTPAQVRRVVTWYNNVRVAQ